MNTREIHQTVEFDVPPEEVYKALMDSDIHSIFTQSEAIIGKKPGDRYEAYDGYIEGTILELIPNKRIVKTWTAYEDSWPDSHITTIIFEFMPNDQGGTILQFLHKDVPDHLYDAFYDGWTEHYWEPMKDYFESLKA